MTSVIARTVPVLLLALALSPRPVRADAVVGTGAATMASAAIDTASPTSTRIGTNTPKGTSTPTRTATATHTTCTTPTPTPRYCGAYLCRGGNAQGEDCAFDSDCPGVAGPGATPGACTFQAHEKLCANAPQCLVSGQDCTDNLDCVAWPEPTPANYCPSNTGLNLPRKGCNANSDCGQCVSGSQKGWACQSDADCPASTCNMSAGTCILGVQQGQDEVYSQGSGSAGDVYVDYCVMNQTCESNQQGIVSSTTARYPVALKYFPGLDKLVHVMSAVNTVRVQGWDAASTLSNNAPISWFLGAIDINHGLWENIPGDVSGSGHMAPNSLTQSNGAPSAIAYDPVTDSFWIHDSDNLREYSSSPHSKDLPNRVLGYSDFTGYKRVGLVCHNGSNDGTTCSPNINCPGGACVPSGGVYTCVGGSNDGNSCDVNAGCTGGGTCNRGYFSEGGADAMPRCNGASSFGTPCTSNAGCTDGTCTTTLALVDRWNSAVDLWVNLSTAQSGQPPDYYLGQIDGVQGSCNQGLDAPTAATLCFPVDVAFDSSGNILVTDSGNNRALGFPHGSKTGAAATVVFGAADFTHAGTWFVGGWPSSITSDPVTGQVSVADTWANRIAVFDAPFTAPVTSISHIIGQAPCTSSWCGQSSDGSKLDRLSGPRTLSSDGNGGLYVGDTLNNRDLHFPAPLATNEAGDLLLGETSPTATEQLSAHTESGWDRGGICFFQANGKTGFCKVVTVHNRALCWNDWTTFGKRGAAPETDADAILGQTDGTGSGANAGGLSAASLSAPIGCTADANYLYIADSDNNRIAKYQFGSPAALTTHQSAVSCLGQSGGSCTTNVASSSGTGLHTPVDVKVSDAGNLWIVDQGNVRVVLDCINAGTDEVCTPANSGDSTWDLTLGVTGSSVCTDPATDFKFCVPQSVVPYGASVLIADSSSATGGARIQQFDQPWSDNMPASATLGQVATTRFAPYGGICVGGTKAGVSCTETRDQYLQETGSTQCPYGYCSYALNVLAGLPISMALSKCHSPAKLWVSRPANLVRWTAPFYTGEIADLKTASNTNHAFDFFNSGYVPSQPNHNGGGIAEAPDCSIWYSNGGGNEALNAIYAMMDPDAATPATAPTATATNTPAPTNAPTGKPTATPTPAQTPTVVPTATAATPTPPSTVTPNSTRAGTNTPKGTSTPTRTATMTRTTCTTPTPTPRYGGYLMCRGGNDQGEACAFDSDCTGIAAPPSTPAGCTFQAHPALCANAPLCMVSAQPCTDNLDCVNWPAPTPSNYCPSEAGLSTHLPWRPCRQDSDCGQCTGGSQPGWSCQSNGDCPGGTCNMNAGTCVIGMQQGEDAVYPQGSGSAGDVYADYCILNQTCESDQNGIVSSTTARYPVALKYFPGLDKLVHVMSAVNTVRVQGWEAASTLSNNAPISWFLGAIDINHGLWENIPGDLTIFGHMAPNGLNMAGDTPSGVAYDPVTDSFWLHDVDNLREYSSSPHSKDLPNRVLGYSDFTGYSGVGWLCRNGTNDGVSCNPDLNCPGGECVPTGGVYTCQGGSNDRKSCSVNASCTGGGTCNRGNFTEGGADAMLRCNGATSFGTPCTSNAGCTDGTCTTTLALVDRWNSAVDLWVNLSTAQSGQPPDYYLGQIDGLQASCNQGLDAPTAATLCFPVDVAFDSSGNILVSDGDNNRALRFPYNSKTGAAATVVFGAADFTHTGTLFGGWLSGITADPVTGQVSIADTWNNRIAVFNPPFTSAVTSINYCIGQPSCTYTSPGQSSDGTKLDRLSSPQPISSDGNGGLYVGDSLNNRDLHFPAPLATNEAGDLLLGETSPTATEQLSAHTESGWDRGGICFFQANGKTGFCKVVTVHNRALCWNDWTTFGKRGAAPETDADAILGQTDGTGSGANAGGLSAASLSAPIGCTADANYLYIADSGNNRIAKYQFGSPAALTTHQSAVTCLGQSGGCTSNVASSSGTGLHTPVDVKVSDAGNLWIVDQGNVRVVLDCINAGTDEVCTPANSGDSTWDLTLGVSGRSVCTDPATDFKFCVPQSVVPYGASVLVADSSSATGGARIQQFDQPWSDNMHASATLGQVATNRFAPYGGVCVGGTRAGVSCTEDGDQYLQETGSAQCPYGYCSYALNVLAGLPISMVVTKCHSPAKLWASRPANLVRWTAPFHTGEFADLKTASNTNHAFDFFNSGYVPSQPNHNGGGIAEAPDCSIWYSNGGGNEALNAIYAMMDPDAATPATAPTATATNTPAPTNAPTGTPTPTAPPTSTPTPCVGDCNGDGHVTVDEILTMVNIALGNETVSACEPGDANRDGQITVDEILTAVNNALNNCRK